jgi:exodeoxyribonuclease-3
MLSFPKNRGLRIDAVLASKSMADRCRDAGVDREMRKGKEPSDHAPIWAEFDWTGNIEHPTSNTEHRS